MSDQQHDQASADASAAQASPEATQMAMALAGMLEQMVRSFSALLLLILAHSCHCALSDLVFDCNYAP